MFLNTIPESRAGSWPRGPDGSTAALLFLGRPSPWPTQVSSAWVQVIPWRWPATNGISGATYDAPLAGISAPRSRGASARQQPSRSSTHLSGSIFDNQVNEESIANRPRPGAAPLPPARRRRAALRCQPLHRAGDLVDRIALRRSTHHPRQAAQHHPLARQTLAYGDQPPSALRDRHAAHCRAQNPSRTANVDVSQMTGVPWAGAMGHTQFIPTQLRSLGRGHGRAMGRATSGIPFPMRSAPAANLLLANWLAFGQAWGYEVRLPEGRRFTRRGTMSPAEWETASAWCAGNGQGLSRRPGVDRAELKGPPGAAMAIAPSWSSHNFNMLNALQQLRP